MGTVGYMSPEQATGEQSRFSFRPVFLRVGALRDGHRISCFPEKDSLRKPRPPSFAMSRSVSVPGCCRRLLRSFGLWSAVWPRIPNNATPPPRIWLATWRRCATGSPRRPSRPSEPRPNNLPVQRTAFIGREHEATALRQLLEPGGCAAGDPHRSGRHREDTTRFAGSGRDRGNQFPGGVCFVPLSAVSDPA